MASRERVVEFAVKARDEFSKVMSNLERQQNKLSAAARAAARRNTLGVAKGEIESARANYARLTADVDRYREAQERIAARYGRDSGEFRELADAIKLTRDRARESVSAFAQKRSALASLSQTANVGFAAMDRLALSMSKANAETIEQNAVVSKDVTALKKLADVTNQAASAETRLAKAQASSSNKGKKGEAQDIEVFGLKPYQLTNLGYQINDVVSGLSMGQAPLQILAQQAGQFAQIWPGVMVSLARGIPIIAATAVALSPFISAALRLKQASDSLKIFRAELILSADGSRYTAEGLTELATAMNDAGTSIDDARQIISAFVREGISPDKFAPLTEMARTLSQITGADSVETAQQLGAAFNGTVEDVRKLDEQLNFLTASQYENILAMDRAGNRVGALAQAQEILRQKLAETKGEQSEWAAAVDDLSDAWDQLVTAIQNSGIIELAAKGLDALAVAARGAATAVKETADVLAGGATEIEQLQNQLEGLQNSVQNWKDATGGDPAQLMDGDPLREQLRMIDELKNKLEIIKGNRLEDLHTQRETNKELGKTVELTEKAKKANIDARASSSGSFSGYGTLAQKVIGVESGGNASAKNPNSSATGLGQFIESTFITLFKKHFPEQAAGMTDSAIALLRKNGEISTKMVELYLSENAAILEKAGAQVNDATLYLAHFLGPGGALSLLTAPGSTPVSEILGADQIKANQSILGGKTADDVLNWAAKKMQMSEQELAIITKTSDIEKERLAKNEEYLKQYTQRIADQRAELDDASKAARQQFIAAKLREEENKARAVGVELTKQQRAEIEALAAKEYDQKNVNEQVNALLERRAALLESLKIAQAAGDQDKVVGVVEQIASVENDLNGAIASAIEFWKALGGPGADEAILKLQNVQASIGKTVSELQTKFLPSAYEINESLADIGASAFESFARAIANGENAADALFDTLLQGLGEFMIEIGKAILKQALFNALSGMGGTGGAGGFLSGIIGSIFHEGGVVGSGGGSRMVNPAVFARATRYHNGGIGGLKANEVPAILEKGEEVLTADDPRHVRNGKGGVALNVKQVNVLNPVELLQAALEDVAGERVLINFIGRNPQKINGILSG